MEASNGKWRVSLPEWKNEIKEINTSYLMFSSTGAVKPILHQSRTAHRARRNTCKLSQPMDATVQHCPATVPAVTGIDRPKLGQRRSSGHTVHTTDEARTALRLSKLRSIKILYTLTMIYDSLYI